MHVGGSRGEDVAVVGGGEETKDEVLACARWPLAESERQLVVQVVELVGDPAPRILGEFVERHADHGFGTQMPRSVAIASTAASRSSASTTASATS